MCRDLPAAPGRAVPDGGKEAMILEPGRDQERAVAAGSRSASP